MKARIASLFLLLPLFVASPVGADDAFKPLFDGRTLKGWTGDESLWSVADGAIVGTTDATELKHNTFLSSTTTYKNFVLKLKFKLRNGNSGIQYRSKQFPDHVVRGYQADIAENMFMGILYEEGGARHSGQRGRRRGCQTRKSWRLERIRHHGRWAHLTQVLNGFTTVDYQEKSEQGAKDGIIALQLHVGPKMRVWFKDIEIRELP